MVKGRRFSVRFDDDLAEALEILKAIKRCDRNAVINIAVEDYVKKSRAAIKSYRRKQAQGQAA